MVHRIIKLVLILFAFTAVISSCYYDNEEELYPGEIVCNTDSLSYDANIATIINTKCALPACHGGPQNPNFTDFNSVSQNKDRIKVRAVEQMTMPPSSVTPLSECEIKQLESWINAGAPQN
ncbi:MAG: hypothetical protein RH860_12005 [Cytophagales bacterium]